MKVEDLKITTYEQGGLIETIDAGNLELFSVYYSPATGKFETCVLSEPPIKLEAPSIAELRAKVAALVPDKPKTTVVAAHKTLIETLSYKGKLYEFFYNSANRMFEVTIHDGRRWSNGCISDLVRHVEKELGCE